MYATATPERFFPKRFDIIGSSHQFFHMLINLALAIHFRAGYKLYLDRFDKVCPINIRWNFDWWYELKIVIIFEQIKVYF